MSGLQRLIEIGDDVFLVLDADREAHHIRRCARSRLLHIVELGT